MLYRLLFILYAEARDLLPLQDNTSYRRKYSLDAIKKDVVAELQARLLLHTSGFFWTRLKELFKAINAGNPPLNVTNFNGGLFDPQRHDFLEQYVVGDVSLCRAIDKLARVKLQFVDFRDLAERHLGTIYEGLLEYTLHLEQGLLSGDAAIIGEPGNRMIAIGHRGLYRFRLTTYGEATHTGIRAWEMGTRGHNAILDMARVAVALAESPLPGSASPAFPQRKSVLTFPTLIRGGSGINIVPGACEAYGDVRLIPGTSSQEIKYLIKKQLARVSINHYRLDDLVVVPPAEIDPQAEIVQTLAAAVQAVTGTHPKREGSGPACDGWMFITRGIPTVCGYGVTHGGVHGADEWADLESLCNTTDVYAHAILHFLSEKLS